jgi:hypothetical protein
LRAPHSETKWPPAPQKVRQRSDCPKENSLRKGLAGCGVPVTAYSNKGGKATNTKKRNMAKNYLINDQKRTFSKLLVLPNNSKDLF